MTIYRGPGGGGNATSDAEITALTALTNQALDYSEAAAIEADAAANSAASASTSAASAAASAASVASSSSAAATSATNAAASAASAATSASTATTQAGIATTQASSATTSATSASTSATSAATSYTNTVAIYGSTVDVSNAVTASQTAATSASSSASSASTSASNAATSATNAASSATSASTSATNAASSATSAQSAQTAAETARDQTLASFDSFDDRYLGAKTADPTLDNDGNALIAGALYFSSTAETMKVYTGSSWVAAYVSGTEFLARSGGTMTGAIVFAGGQTFPGTGDVTLTGTQTLTNKTIAYASNTLTGVAGVTATQTLTNKTITNIVLDGSVTEDVYVLAGTVIDAANGTIQTKTLSANTTFTESLVAGQSVTLMIDDGTAYTVTWPTMTWKTDLGAAPTLNTTGYTVVVLWKVNSTLYGARVGNA